MKIISPFKDYYDYLAYIYGVDSRITYVRNMLAEPIIDTPLGKSERTYYDVDSKKLEFKVPHFDEFVEDKVIVKRYPFVIVAGCRVCYMMTEKRVVKHQPGSVISKNVKPYVARKNVGSFWKRLHVDKIVSDNFQITDMGVQLTRRVGHPVFIIGHTRYDGMLEVGVRVPKLTEYGIDKIITPETMYQDIEYTLTSVLHEDPKPEPITDLDKVKAHGFDTKTSFRGK